jgi:anti-anti-sigma factor
MQIHQTIHEGVTVIALAGRVDTTTSGAVEDAVRGTVDGGARDLVIDFSEVEYISSAGLRVFLVLAKRMRDLRGRVVLCGMGPPVRQVFQLAGFLPLFTVASGRDAALGLFVAQP